MVILSFNSGESSTRTRALTYTLPNLNSINNVKVNTGSVSVTSINGDQATIQVSGGSSTRSAITGWSSNPDLSKYVENQTSSNYSDSSGYRGTLSAYTTTVDVPSDTKYATASRSGSRTIIHRWDGASIGWTTVNSFYSGDTAIIGQSDAQLQSPRSYNTGGYSGTLYFTNYSQSGSLFPNYSGSSIGETATSTITAYVNHGGNVTKPASTTSATRYRGTAYKSQSDSPIYTYYYQYQITFDYIDFVAPPVNVDGVYREVKEVFTNVDGTWRKVTNIHSNVNGVWKQHVK